MSQAVVDRCGWVALAGEYRDFAPLSGDQNADWVVIGGGFTGLAAARRIAELEPEARVMVLEGKRVGQGASGRNSGFVVAHESPGHAGLSTASGRADYAALSAIDGAGVAALKALVGSHNIDCQWEDTGSIHGAANPRNYGRIHAHAAAFEALGIKATVLEGAVLRARLGTGFYGVGVEVRGGALVQPAMLAKGLLNSLPEQIEVFEKTEVQSVAVEAGRVEVRCASGTVRTAKVVVAVNAFLPRLGLYADKVFPLALTASLTRVLNAQEEAELGQAASWGVLAPRSMGATLRLTKDRRILIRNTGEYDPSGISAAALARRRAVHLQGLMVRFPWLGQDAIAHTWSGNICVSRNAKPVFTDIDNKIFISGGYNASGVARGTMMGQLIVERALGVGSELLEQARSISPPTRIPPRPFFDVGAKARIALERWQARGEV